MKICKGRGQLVIPKVSTSTSAIPQASRKGDRSRVSGKSVQQVTKETQESQSVNFSEEVAVFPKSNEEL